MEMTNGQERVLESTGHLLIFGGPGSGKTTVSILKAAKIAATQLRHGEAILFLSFARATVSRVAEAIEQEQRIPPEFRERIEVETYHSFFWRLLRTHGYLTGLPRHVSILPPPQEAIALSVIRDTFSSKRNLTDEQKSARASEHAELEGNERVRLAESDGRICFSLFARYVHNLIEHRQKIRRLIATAYPFIILDEFQDTDDAQWDVVRLLGEFSQLIAVADPEQRIYEWLGASPARLDHFRIAFSPAEFDLGSTNHRSAGTDITRFGNDILTGLFTQEEYVGIKRTAYEPYGAQPTTALILEVYAARTRLSKLRSDWTLAILVPTKLLTRVVSDAFRRPPGELTPISHSAAIEMEGAILAAEVIAFLLQPQGDDKQFDKLVELLRHYYLGRGGDRPTRKDLDEASKFQKAFLEFKVRIGESKLIRGNSILRPTIAAFESVRSMTLSGDPNADWRRVRASLEGCACVRMQAVAEDVRDVRMLERGTQLRQDLTQDWRENGAYRNALSIVRQAFVREHFASGNKPEVGVLIMNMHKAKGKQFDEVIIFESAPKIQNGEIIANAGRIVRNNDRAEINSQCRQNLRVSVTRGKRRSTILTPKNDPCVLLLR